MTNLTSQEYHNECQELLSQGIQEAIEQGAEDIDGVREFLSDARLHETLDGHEYVIYYSTAEEVARHISKNDEAWRDCYSDTDCGQYIADKGIESWFCVCAYFAMMQDVWDLWDDDEVEEALQRASETTCNT